ncbi:MAG: hypothetical protein NT016_03010 [Candidatus Aenigmarchaeota archaeon]|nr:hypothetical protein [Candidatus Aenigmarchaeota archaeon]
MTNKMKIMKTIAFVIPALMIVAVAALALTARAARADDVNLNIEVNGSAQLDITVQADDTAAREAIAGTQQDVYGTGAGLVTTTTVPTDGIETFTAETTTTTTLPVNPVDEVFQAITTSGYETVDQICSDYYNPSNFRAMGSMAPSDFVAQLKALGYDDETHINTIWNLCQQKYIDSGNQALSSSIAATGASQQDVASYITGAIDWLAGRTKDAPAGYKAVGSALGSYFATKQDLAMVADNSYGNINRLGIRLEAVERTLERITPEEYCQVKVELMLKYNLSAVKCGENSTFYYKIPNSNSPNGYDIIGVTAGSEVPIVPPSMQQSQSPQAPAHTELPIVEVPQVPVPLADTGAHLSGAAIMPTLVKNFTNFTDNVSAMLSNIAFNIESANVRNIPRRPAAMLGSGV